MAHTGLSKLDVYCWGSNLEGQLGYGGEDNVLEPMLQSNLTDKDIRSIAAGARHTVCVAEGGIVYSFGCNDHLQLGHNKRRTRPEVIDALDAFVIVQVACGNRHTLALTEDGQVLSWGAGDRGQLGQGLDALTNTTGSKPHKIKDLLKHRVVQIAAGDAHCLALTETGAVYAWGENTQGQLGLGSFVAEHSPKRVMGLWGHPVIKIACGGTHSLAITASGALYSWGNNQFGQIGLGNEPKKLRPTLISDLKGKYIVDIAAGESHSAALTKEGRVYVFGSGSNGQLGNDSDQHEYHPKLLVELMGASSTFIACGRRHTLVYQADNQRLYSFGLNASGQLGTASTKSSKTPVAIKSVAGKAVVGLFCGGDQTFCLALPSIDGQSQEQLTVQKESLKRPLWTDPEAEPTPMETAPIQIPIANQSQNDTPSPTMSPVTFAAMPTSYYAIVTSLKPKQPCYLNLPLLQSLLSDPYRLGNAQHMIETTFSSIACLNGSFLAPNHHTVSSTFSGVDMDNLREAYSLIWSHSNSLLATTVGHATSKLVKALESYDATNPENARVYLALLENPLLLSPNLFHIVIQQVVTLILGLKNDAKTIVTSWWAHLESSFFFRVVQVFQTFLSFLSSQGSKLNLDNSITTCAVVLEWLYKINLERSIIPIKVFFNAEVSSRLDVLEDYQIWQSNPNLFCFGRYPFLLQTSTKVRMLHIDAARQMQEQVREAMIRQLALKEEASPLLMLKLVRGPSLVADVMTQLARLTTTEYHKPVLVKFEGEEGQDEGGVRKEMFNLVTKEVISPEFGMFTYDEDTRMLWFDPFSRRSAEEFRLVGVLFGLAVFNAILLDVNFTPILYKKLLMQEPTLQDLHDFQPNIAQSLQALLEYEGPDVAEVFGLTYAVNQRSHDGTIVTHELKKGGADMAVTQYNKADFVQRYVRFLTVQNVEAQFVPFAEGFKAVINDRILKLFHPKELEQLIRGAPNYHFHDLEEATKYANGYSRDHPVIKNFWQVFHSLTSELKRKFLIFLSGSDRVPLGGLKSMRFIIQRVANPDLLPVAHTCFNILDLPEYSSLAVLQEKLIYAILNTQEGFGLV